MRRGAPVILCAGVVFGLAGATEVEAFRIPSFRIPTIRVPTVRMPAMRTQIAPRIHGMKSPQLSRLHGPRLSQQTSKMHRATSLARKVPGTGKSRYQPTSVSQSKSQAAAAKKGPMQSVSQKPTASKWIDCHASGGVWGHNGSCGHPTFGSVSSSASRAWTYFPLASLPLVTRFVSDVVVSSLASPPPPPPPPGNNNPGGCDMGGNGDPATLNCEASDDDKLVDAVNARSPERTCDGKEHCTEIDCDGHKGTISGAVVSQPQQHNLLPFVLIKYEGTKAADLKWVQFIWTEILVRKKLRDNQEAWPGIAGLLPLNTTNGPLKLTTDPSNPNYRVDTMDPYHPYYGGGSRVPFPNLPPFTFARLAGAHARDATSEVIADMPSTAIPLVRNDPPFFEVEQRDHFDDFLISDGGKVCGKISWLATFTSSRVPSISESSRALYPTYTVSDPDTSSMPNSAQIRQLRDQFPSYPSDALR